MVALGNLLSCKSSRFSSNPITRHPVKSIGAGSLILLVVAALGLYVMLPELRRYIRIERM
jgi:hypothetical protein